MKESFDSVGRQAFSETNSSPFIDQKNNFPAKSKTSKNGKAN